MILLGQFVLAFAVARWIDRLLVQRLERLLWERMVLWSLIVMGLRQRVREMAHGDD